MPMVAQPVGPRLWAKLKRDGGCLVFTGSTGQSGHGQISVQGRQQQAHRVAWELENGPIPGGLLCLHSCDNPPCCNVDHLYLGTQRDNMQDCVRRGRHPNRNRTACDRGHEYNEENTYVDPNGWRICKVCRRLNHRKRRRKAGLTIRPIKP